MTRFKITINEEHWNDIQTKINEYFKTFPYEEYGTEIISIKKDKIKNTDICVGYIAVFDRIDKEDIKEIEKTAL